MLVLPSSWPMPSAVQLYCSVLEVCHSSSFRAHGQPTHLCLQETSPGSASHLSLTSPHSSSYFPSIQSLYLLGLW